MQYSILIGAVIASAVIPTFIAQKWFMPVHSEDIDIEKYKLKLCIKMMEMNKEMLENISLAIGTVLGYSAVVIGLSMTVLLLTTIFL